MLERRKGQEMGEAGWQLRSQIFVFCLVAWKPAISGRRNKGPSKIYIRPQLLPPSPAFFCLSTFFSSVKLRKITIKIHLFTSVQKKKFLTRCVAEELHF